MRDHPILAGRPLAGILAAATLALGACDSGVSDRVLNVEAFGRVWLTVYRDNNLNGRQDANVDGPVIEAPVDLHRVGLQDPIFRSVTDSSGFAPFTTVGVGHYRLDILPSVLGDSMMVISSPGEFTIAANDTLRLSMGLAFNAVTVTEARSLPLGERRWVRGVALNGPGTFGDSTVHLADSLAAIRTTGVRQAPVSAGDTVVMLGSASRRDDQPTMEIVSILIVASGPTPPPDTVSAATATSANGGALDAAFVHVRNATVTDTATAPDGSFSVNVTDGSGTLQVVLVAALNFRPFNTYSPGVILNISGLLVPQTGATGLWALRPRGRGDITIPIPATVTTAAAPGAVDPPPR